MFNNAPIKFDGKTKWSCGPFYALAVPIKKAKRVKISSIHAHMLYTS